MKSFCPAENIQGTQGGERLWRNTKVWSSYCFLFFFCACLSVLSQLQQKGYKKILPVHSSLCSSLASFKVLWPLLIFECCLQVVQGNKSFELCVSVCVCAVPMYLTLASAKSKFSWELWEESSFLLTPYCYEMTFEIISSWSYLRGV